jgi:pilus assembly protein CpaF
MRPDRIIVGEVRGAEAMDMLQAMNTGHEGSMATVHANTPRDALSRIENMVSMAEMSLSVKAVRQQISAAIWVVIQVSRMQDGKRKLTSIQEITGMEGDIITMQEIFTFTQTGIDENGVIQGNFHATGIRPSFSERLKIFGVSLGDELFDPSVRFE